MSTKNIILEAKEGQKLVQNGVEEMEAVHDGPVTSAFEKMLKMINPDGIFQKRLIFWFMIPFCLLYGFAEVHFIFIVSTPDHVCHVPGIEKFNNMTLEEWHNLTIPWEKGPDGTMKLNQCKMYNISFDGYEDDDITEIVQSTSYLGENSSYPTIGCQYGWDYDDSVWKSTAVTNYNWVCEDKGKVTSLLTLKMIGGAIGNFVFALLSDRYGRFPIFYICLILLCTFGPLMAVASSTLVFSIFLFFFSLPFYSIYQAPFLIVMEICSEKLRSLNILSTFIAWILGCSGVSLLCWLLAEYKLILLVLNLPMAVFFFYWRFLPESPRLLLTKDEIPKFKKVMRKIAAKNSSVITLEFDDLVLKAREEEKKKVPFSQILKSFVLAKHLILICVLYGLYFTVNSGIIFNLHNMTGNIFINYFILTIFDIPGSIIGNWASDYLGRRMSSVLFEILSAICFIIPIIFINNEWIVVVFCAAAKMFCAAMTISVYQQIGEIFPTPLRATAYGVTGNVGMAASVFAPSITALGQENQAIPYYIMCVFSVLCALICSFLPETLGLPYPQTMREAISIGKNQSYFSIIYKGNVHKKLHQTKAKKVRMLDISEAKA
ncbi:UNVERIFIED_CONTAM: hypothetical protein RMT77_000283 [Armadillidium vulgare]